MLEADLSWSITKESTEGFTIKLNTTAPIDTRFSWTALAIVDVKTTTGQRTNAPGIEPATPSPTVTSAPLETPELKDQEESATSSASPHLPSEELEVSLDDTLTASEPTQAVTE